MVAVRSLIVVVLMTSMHVFSDTNISECINFDLEEFKLIKGEAFHVVPLEMSYPVHPDTKVTWYKESTDVVAISSDETNRIHHHSGALLLFDLHTADTGDYVALEEEPSGECFTHSVRIKVFDPSFRGNKSLCYGSVNNSDVNKEIRCPDPVSYTCKKFKGSYSWYKDSSFLPGQNEASLRINKVTKDDEGVYICVCTWTHNGRSHNSSGSREMIHQGPYTYFLYILSPTITEQFADEGSAITLKCSILCGFNVIDVHHDCSVTWRINGKPFTQMDGYSQTPGKPEPEDLNFKNRTRSKRAVVTALLTIAKVSSKDFQTEFTCFGENPFNVKSRILTLKPRVSMTPLVIRGLLVLLFFVSATVLVKFFAIDLVLFFRPYIPRYFYRKDTRKYDAYVAYRTQRIDTTTEETLCQFITETLPYVLETKCGYRLFIQGRDDLPGEDHLEMVEDCMNQSRRLIAILTPSTGSQSDVTEQPSASNQSSPIEGFDWQVGLHYVLMQRELSVILIQLGHMGSGGYIDLPLGLQHLIRRNAPIRWSGEPRGTAAWNSRFWKRVRYLMPAKPAAEYTLTAIT